MMFCSIVLGYIAKDFLCKKVMYYSNLIRIPCIFDLSINIYIYAIWNASPKERPWDQLMYLWKAKFSEKQWVTPWKSLFRTSSHWILPKLLLFNPAPLMGEKYRTREIHSHQSSRLPSFFFQSQHFFLLTPKKQGGAINVPLKHHQKNRYSDKKHVFFHPKVVCKQKTAKKGWNRDIGKILSQIGYRSVLPTSKHNGNKRVPPMPTPPRNKTFLRGY